MNSFFSQINDITCSISYQVYSEIIKAFQPIKLSSFLLPIKLVRIFFEMNNNKREKYF